MKQIIPLLLAALILTTACGKEDPNKNEGHELVEISTTYGTMAIWLYDETPQHKANFLKLAREGFYNSTTFHRVIKNFMIQGGDPNSKDSDPNNDGQGGPGYTIPAEILDTIKHQRGCLAAARLGNAQNPQKASSGSQFYIAVSTSGTQHLNGEYTVFGQVLNNIHVADSIVAQPTGPGDRPLQDIQMQVQVIRKTAAELESQYGWVVK